MRDDALSVIVCGAASALSAPGHLAKLRRHVPHPMRILLTHSATRFLAPAALTWYADELFTADAADLNPTEFAQRSRCVLVLPATANMIAAAALGIAATPAQTAVLAAPGPVLFFPAMHRTMWDKAPTRRHVATLRGDGHIVIDPPEQEIYEFWRRETTTGIAPPPSDEILKAVLARLESVGG